MKEQILVRRYAEAFMSYAADTIGIKQATDEFRVLKWIVVENPQFIEILSNPAAVYGEKKNLVEKVLGKHFSRELCNFLDLLVDKRRIDLLVGIADYIRINYALDGAVETVLRMAYPLELDLIAAIKTKLEKKFDRPVKLYLALDPTLLGGVQIVMGNTIIDGSVKKRLTELKDKLQSASVV